jgi:hypothetical protein
MEAQYELTVDDLVAFNLSHFRRSPTMRRIYLTILLLAWISVPAGIAIFLVQSYRAEASPLAADLVPFLITWAVLHSVVFAFLVYRGYRRGASTFFATAGLARRLIREGDLSSLVGRYKLTISPTSIVEISPRAESTIQMAAVQRIVVADQHAFVYVSPIQAFVIPRRAFPQSVDFEHFIQKLEEFSHVIAARN